MAVVALLIICIFLIVVLSIYSFIRKSIGLCKCSRHMVGKVIIVTGGSNGIGFETAKDLAERGARVIITSTKEERGKKTKERLISLTNNNNIISYELDLNSLSSVRHFAEKIIETESKVDILINNAGAFITENVKTADGLLQGMQVNYFGPFLLTQLLLPKLKSSTPSRIINVSSIVYKYGTVNCEDLNMENVKFSSFKAYNNAKLCTVLASVELSRLLQGTGVTVNCLHPGTVGTGILNETHVNKILFTILKYSAKPFIKTPWEGAQTSIYLAVSPEVDNVSGSYFSDCNDIGVTKTGSDPNLARRLYELTKTTLKLE